MSRSSKFIVTFGTLMFCCATHAELRFCNETAIRISTAVGYKQNGAWYAEGWWTLWPGECATVFTDDLPGRSLYGHAHAGDHSWGGPYSFCTSSNAFRVPDSNACGETHEDFFKIDKNPETEKFTQSFTCDTCSASEVTYDASSHSISASHLASFVTSGVTVHLPLDGQFNAQAGDAGLAIQMRLTANLEHLQSQIGAILAKATDRSEECGDRVHTYGASLQPRGSQAIFRARVRYEKWNCTSMDVPQVKCEDTWIKIGPMKTKGIPRCRTWFGTTRTSKTKLLQQSGTVRIALTPVVQGRNTIRMRANVESVDLDGLGDFVADLLNLDLKNQAQRKLDDALGGSRMSLAAPDELRPYISVDTVEFYDGGDSLRLRANGSFAVTSASAAPLCKRLFDAGDCGALWSFQ